MAKVKGRLMQSKPVLQSKDSKTGKKKQASGTSSASRESQLVHLATVLAEKQLREGTAASQVILHYLKLGSSINLLEKAKLEHETELLKAKTSQIAETEQSKEAYKEALNAILLYRGEKNNVDQD